MDEEKQMKNYENKAAIAALLALLFLFGTPYLIAQIIDNDGWDIVMRIIPFLLSLLFLIYSRKYSKKAKELISKDAKRAQKYQSDLKQNRIIVAGSLISVSILICANQYYQWGGSVFLCLILFTGFLMATIGFVVRRLMKNQQLGLGN